MSAIIRENASAARMIAMPVNQQGTGISHISTAVSRRAHGMGAARQRVETTLDAPRSLKRITQGLQEIERRYEVSGCHLTGCLPCPCKTAGGNLQGSSQTYAASGGGRLG
ncbi:MAG TPA: hypothetical protein VE153_19745, partial [Myxococcus sp.]|nr:hypothetical protein [Myxococcus sp.]